MAATPPFILRPARRDDAPDIARLFLISSDGLAEYIWSQIEGSETDILAVGAMRYARDDVAFSYQNCQIAEHDGAVVGMLHAFEMTADDEIETDPVLRPYAELEDPGSLYVSGVAVDAACRGGGIGRALMAFAEERADAENLPRVSLICFEPNAGALRLYRSLGYREVDRRAIVPHPCLHYASGDALLLVKDLG